MHKKYHEKFKILDILAVTTQAHEGIETFYEKEFYRYAGVTTQAHEGIETHPFCQLALAQKSNNSSP